MLAYHGKETLRKEVIATMAAHRKADELIQGYGYWKDGKGCAVGCLIKGNDHSEYEPKFGIPEMLARLEDSIFEGLPNKEAQKWPEKFLSSIKAGMDLSLVGWRFQLWLQIDNKEFAEKQKMPDDVIAAINSVIPILKTLATKGKLTEQEILSAESAESAADSAAAAAALSVRSAARSAAWSARSAARSAWLSAESAESAAWSAWSAARSASWSEADSAWSAAESEAWSKMADKLIEIIKETPVQN